ncbi:MAG: alkyl hydroperoxide reductase, partial [Armatimonadetes bacterium]|nr:alkyl hydroperoxide reductase [Akkermansiaceae bacterium]
MRRTLLLLGAYHLLFAIWAICCPHNAFDLLGIPRPNHPTLWRVLGIIIGALGIALIIGAENPIRHWPIVLVLFIKS